MDQITTKLNLTHPGANFNEYAYLALMRETLVSVSDLPLNKFIINSVRSNICASTLTNALSNLLALLNTAIYQSIAVAESGLASLQHLGRFF